MKPSRTEIMSRIPAEGRKVIRMLLGNWEDLLIEFPNEEPRAEKLKSLILDNIRGLLSFWFKKEEIDNAMSALLSCHGSRS